MTLCRNVLEKYPASSDAVYTGLSSDVLAGSYNLRELDGLTLVVLQDRADALRPLNSFITLVVCVLILIVFAVCSLQIFVIRHMTKPLIQIRESMKTVNIDHMEMELIPSDSSNELEVLRHTSVSYTHLDVYKRQCRHISRATWPHCTVLQLPKSGLQYQIHYIQTARPSDGRL